MTHHKLAALTAILLSGCFMPADSPLSPLPKGSFQGYVRFSGEFRLYDHKSSTGLSDECISGTLPVNEQIKAMSLDGKVVRIQGQLMQYENVPIDPGFEENVHLIWKGAPILNQCGGRFVILANRVEAAR